MFKKLPESHHQLIYLIIDKLKEPIDYWPQPTPVFVPIFAQCAKAWLRLKPYFVEEITVICDDREMVSEFQTSRPGVVVRSFASLKEGELFLKSVLVVATPEVDAHQLLLSFALARDSLVIAFIHNHPHPLLRKIKSTVNSLLEDNAQFVNWEVRPPRKRKRETLERYEWYKGARDVPTVKELVHHLVKAIPAKGEGRFQVAAHLLGWTEAPKMSYSAQGTVNLVPPGLSDAWKIIAGNAAEHLVERAACQVVKNPGDAHFIVPAPECVFEFLSGIACDDPLMREALNKHYRIRRSTMTQKEWIVHFESCGITTSAERDRIALLLHNRAPPHLLVDPLIFTPAVQDMVKRAADERFDTYSPSPDERAWWVLGATDYYINHNDAAPLLALHRDHHFSPSSTIPDLFKRALRQLRTVLSQLSVQSITSQIPSNAKGKYRGKADFIINRKTVLELKFSPNDAQHFEWALQAAIYAHTHRLKHFFVLNLGTGSYWDYWMCRMDV